MPEQHQLRALLAVQDVLASSALRAYIRARSGIIEVARNGDLANTVRVSSPDVVLLQTDSSENPLGALRREFPKLCVVIFTAAPAEVAFDAARLGAAAMVTLPLHQGALEERLEPVLQRLSENPAAGVNGAGKVAESDAGLPQAPFPGLFSSSARMAEIRDTIDKVATTSATVLIRGESGVGKEIVARSIFAQSQRKLKPFIKVNCAAIPNDLLESELFGYEAGAFTGAQRAKPGKFELADGGTLFLDEIGEMHPTLQAKLLHVLQDGEFSRLGAKRDVAVDVRVLCATNKLLEQRVAQGEFREDLLYRINVVTIHIPPLRERRDEIPVLLRYFIERYSTLYQRTVPPLPDEVMRFAMTYGWPGNIRELENLCKRYVIMGGVGQFVRELTAHALGVPQTIAAAAESPAISAPASLARELSLLEIGRRAAWAAECEAIHAMLKETRWNRREAARRLQVSYKALLNKIRQMEGIEPSRGQ